MTWPKKMAPVLICIILHGTIMCANAEEEIDDVIDIFEANKEVIAIIKGETASSIDLRTQERVQWSGAAGYMAAFLTNERFCVISSSSGGWRALPLRIEESRTGDVHLSPFMVLLVTRNRGVAFQAKSNRFIELTLPIHDEVVFAKAEKYVALVVTSKRAFGFSTLSSTFFDIFFWDRETIEEVKVTARKATIQTSARLLSFGDKSSGWREYRP